MTVSAENVHEMCMWSKNVDLVPIFQFVTSAFVLSSNLLSVQLSACWQLVAPHDFEKAVMRVQYTTTD
jgi:hypothetical protein